MLVDLLEAPSAVNIARQKLQGSRYAGALLTMLEEALVGTAALASSSLHTITRGLAAEKLTLSPQIALLHVSGGNKFQNEARNIESGLDGMEWNATQASNKITCAQ